MAKTKAEKLAQLDTLVLDRLIDIMSGIDDDDEGLEALSTLATPINYLRNNSVLSDKPKSTVEEETKKRLDDAKKRREQGGSK